MYSAHCYVHILSSLTFSAAVGVQRRGPRRRGADGGGRGRVPSARLRLQHVHAAAADGHGGDGGSVARASPLLGADDARLRGAGGAQQHAAATRVSVSSGSCSSSSAEVILRQQQLV